VRAWAPAIGEVPGREDVVEGNHAPWEAVAERDGELDAGEVYIRFGDGRRVCLVKLVNAVIRNGTGDEGSDEVRTTAFFHRYNLHVQACLSTDHSDDV